MDLRSALDFGSILKNTKTKEIGQTGSAKSAILFIQQILFKVYPRSSFLVLDDTHQLPIHLMFYPEAISPKEELNSYYVKSYAMIDQPALLSNISALAEIAGVVSEDIGEINAALEENVDTLNLPYFEIKVSNAEVEMKLGLQLDIDEGKTFITKVTLDDNTLLDLENAVEFDANGAVALNELKNLAYKYDIHSAVDPSVARWFGLTSSVVQPSPIESLDDVEHFSSVARDVKESSIVATYLLGESTLVAGYASNFRINDENVYPPERAVLWLVIDVSENKPRTIHVKTDWMNEAFIQKHMPKGELFEESDFGILVKPQYLKPIEDFFDRVTKEQKFATNNDEFVFQGKRKWPYSQRSQ